MVVIDPPWPVFIAWSMSKASPRRHSPTMIRSGRMRSALATSSRALTPGFRRLPLGQQADTVGMRDGKLKRVFDRNDSLGLRDTTGPKSVENGGFAASRSANHEDVHLSRSHRL